MSEQMPPEHAGKHSNQNSSYPSADDNRRSLHMEILSLAEYLHNFQPSSETHEAFNLQRKQLVDDTPSKNN
jgi:hypothetical protein